MMKKLGKIEEKLNQQLRHIGLILLNLWLRLAPVSLTSKLREAKLKVSAKLLIYKKEIAQFLISLKESLKQMFSKISSILMPILKKLNMQGLLSLLEKSKSFSTQIPQKGYLREKYTRLSSPMIQKLKVWKSNEFFAQYRIAAISFLMILTGSLSIYFSSQDIYDKEFGGRAPASIISFEHRPEYKDYTRKSMKIFNIKVPVYIESASSVGNITIDFSVRTTTRFARHYLEEYEYKLKDYFFTTVEPVVSKFPLEREGKEVLKEKIQIEINNFLRDENVEGEVEAIEITYIVGT